MIEVKICGINDLAAIDAALDAGADVVVDVVVCDRRGVRSILADNTDAISVPGNDVVIDLGPAA